MFRHLMVLWHAQILSTDSPWVSAMFPYDMLAARWELTGASINK